MLEKEKLEVCTVHIIICYRISLSLYLDLFSITIRGNTLMIEEDGA